MHVQVTCSKEGMVPALGSRRKGKNGTEKEQQTLELALLGQWYV